MTMAQEGGKVVSLTHRPHCNVQASRKLVRWVRKIRKASISFVMSVRPHGTTKLDIWAFFSKNLPRK